MTDPNHAAAMDAALDNAGRSAGIPADPRARELLRGWDARCVEPDGHGWREHRLPELEERITRALWAAEHAGFLRARAAAARIPQRLGCGCGHGLHADDCPTAIAESILALEDSP